MKLIGEQMRRKNQMKGRWTKSEHDRFMKGLEKYGKDWMSVQKYVKSRTLTQVRSHAQKVFLKMEEEDIKALFSSQDEYSARNHEPLIRRPKEQEELDYKHQVEETFEPKPAQKKQHNLLLLFMQAIRQQSEQPSVDYRAATQQSPDAKIKPNETTSFPNQIVEEGSHCTRELKRMASITDRNNQRRITGQKSGEHLCAEIEFGEK